MKSQLHQLRQEYIPQLPNDFSDLSKIDAVVDSTKGKPLENLAIELAFPSIKDHLHIKFQTSKSTQPSNKLRVGVLLSGGQAPGGHNVIIGLYDALKKIHPGSQLIGFCNGPGGLVDNDSVELTEVILKDYRNQGGFDLIGSGRTKIQTKEQFKRALDSVNEHELDGLVVVGGDDSNTNAAFLAEYFLQNKCKTVVVGVPKTIDGDLKNSEIECSFGFDTASKVYSEIIGNIMRDAFSAKKVYFFIKIMGRSASHLALECALKTHPNLTFISERIAAKKQSLKEVINEISDLVQNRSEQKKEYGVILIPEGLIEVIPEFNALINEINGLSLKLNPLPLNQKLNLLAQQLTDSSKKCFELIPQEISAQLLMDPDAHGNIQVAKIETERLLMELVKRELDIRKGKGQYKGKFSAQPFYCGYEGRASMPSNFDANYCSTLGTIAALLIRSKLTGYMCAVEGLVKSSNFWITKGVPLVSMMASEVRQNQTKLVIEKSYVDLSGKPYLTFEKQSKEWAIKDCYCYPGPIQYFGPKEVTDQLTETLLLETQ